jgi:hypothetical protein
MRAVISLLATTFVLGSFAVNNQDQVSNTEIKVLLSAKPKSVNKPRRNDRPTSYRGSGRRELV